jgi:CubicO group peptidase (beta-lactamase class C family)
VREKVLFERIQEEDVIAEPGKHELYSDLGYIILGRLVEKVSGEKLNVFWKKNVISPLDLDKSLFFAVNNNFGRIPLASTGSCQWSNKELCGLVHDDNCRSIGGVAGHAGLFGTAAGVLSLMEIMLRMYNNNYAHPSFSFDPVRARLKENHGRWVLGFDTPTGHVPSSGKHFSSKTLGHLGFTGTSFWMDCRQKIGVVVMTNRVLCTADLEGIRRFRPIIHDCIMEKLSLVNGR